MMTNEKAVISSEIPKAEDRSHSKALQCAQAVINKKAENAKILNLSGVSGVADYFVICSALSDRQVQAIADSVSEVAETHGYPLLSSEGYSEGRWVVLDLGDVIVHIFLDALRDYYDLERLWAEAPTVPIPSEFYGPASTRLN